MPVSRRGFLGCATAGSMVGLVGGLRWAFAPANAGAAAATVLADPGSSCVLRESVAGYESALSSANVPYQRAGLQQLPCAQRIILPAAALADESKLAQVKSHLEGGATVLFESGAGFLSDVEFDSHRRAMNSAFGLSLHTPVRLWCPSGIVSNSPYIDYGWPIETKVRDFSRMIPVYCGGSEAIAWFGGQPVAARRRVGKGTLVFLGSPLGPHLLVGDREAVEWFGAFCAAA